MESFPQWIIAILEIGASLFLSSGELPPPKPFAETNYSALTISQLCSVPDGRVILTYQEEGATSPQYFQVKYLSTCLGGEIERIQVEADIAAIIYFFQYGTQIEGLYATLTPETKLTFDTEISGDFNGIQIIPQ